MAVRIEIGVSSLDETGYTVTALVAVRIEMGIYPSMRPITCVTALVAVRIEIFRDSTDIPDALSPPLWR